MAWIQATVTYDGCLDPPASNLIPRDPGSPKLRMVLEPKYDLRFGGDEGHPSHHLRI